MTVSLISEKGARLIISLPDRMEQTRMEEIIKREKECWNNTEWKVRVYGKIS